eukprot:83302-Pyramimonas_sp.AAC.1
MSSSSSSLASSLFVGLPPLPQPPLRPLLPACPGRRGRARDRDRRGRRRLDAERRAVRRDHGH